MAQVMCNHYFTNSNRWMHEHVALFAFERHCFVRTTSIGPYWFSDCPSCHAFGCDSDAIRLRQNEHNVTKPMTSSSIHQVPLDTMGSIFVDNSIQWYSNECIWFTTNSDCIDGTLVMHKQCDKLRCHCPHRVSIAKPINQRKYYLLEATFYWLTLKLHYDWNRSFFFLYAISHK